MSPNRATIPIVTTKARAFRTRSFAASAGRGWLIMSVRSGPSDDRAHDAAVHSERRAAHRRGRAAGDEDGERRDLVGRREALEQRGGPGGGEEIPLHLRGGNALLHGQALDEGGHALASGGPREDG